VTGRFFEPRVSEEFYANQTDFDNVHNLIDAPEHQNRIAELKSALRKKQLELRDSGLMPEKMRERRAAANGITIYELVRNEELYPLEQYLDAADVALERNPDRRAILEGWLGSSDEAMRWWGVVGLHLLEDRAAPSRALLIKALQDSSDEVKMMSAWTLIRLGEPADAMRTLETLLLHPESEHSNTTMLHNVLDWMGPPALPLVKKYIDQGGNRQGRYGIGILGRIAQLNGW